MRVLGLRPVTAPAELAPVVAECLPPLDPGLRLLERAANAGEVTVDLACVDGARRLVLIMCDIVAGPDAVLRAVEGAAEGGGGGRMRPKTTDLSEAPFLYITGPVAEGAR